MALKLFKTLFFVTSMLATYSMSQNTLASSSHGKEIDLCEKSYCWDYNFFDQNLEKQTISGKLLSDNCINYESDTTNIITIDVNKDNNMYEVILGDYTQKILFERNEIEGNYELSKTDYLEITNCDINKRNLYTDCNYDGNCDPWETIDSCSDCRSNYGNEYISNYGSDTNSGSCGGSDCPANEQCCQTGTSYSCSVNNKCPPMCGTNYCSIDEMCCEESSGRCSSGGSCESNNTPYCGDGICDLSESCACMDCSMDTKCQSGPTCGDGTCDSSEDCSCMDCTSDTKCQSGSTCGDGTCDQSESCDCQDCTYESRCKSCFQGQEKEIILLSLVRSNVDAIIGFLKDYRRMNVALTRAKEQLFVIGDSTTIGQDPFYAKFLEYMEEVGGYKSAWELM